MGPPGAGKGTQGELLAEWLGVPRFSTGDMLREARQKGSTLGTRARRYMDAGELVPDDVILGLIDEAMARRAGNRGFILDGFPRTVAQAEGLGALLSRRGERLDAVIDLKVPEDELVSRLSRRRVCGSCGEVTASSGNETELRCPACGGQLIQRSDDRPETVRRRLEVYRGETAPVLEWYGRSDSPVKIVDGTGTVDEVQARLKEALGG